MLSMRPLLSSTLYIAAMERRLCVFATFPLGWLLSACAAEVKTPVHSPYVPQKIKPSLCLCRVILSISPGFTADPLGSEPAFAFHI